MRSLRALSRAATGRVASLRRSEDGKPERNPTKLFRVEGDKAIYQAVGGVRVKVPSREIFEAQGHRWEDVQDVGRDHALALLPLANLEGTSRGARSRKGGPRKQRPLFQTFEEFINAAYTNPNLIRSPFTEYDQRVLGIMEWQKKQLEAHYGRNASSTLVSVIMPTYNRAHKLPKSILSVLGQSHERWELLIVDDGSQDGTADLVASFGDKRIRYIEHDENRGHAAARNTGLRAAGGDYVAFLDSDDAWDEAFLRIMLGQCEERGSPFAYSAQMVWRPPTELDRNGERQKILRYAPFNRPLLENNNYISMIAVLHSRELIEQAGFLDETFLRYADWEYFLRLTCVEAPLTIPAILSHYFQESDGGTVSSREDKPLHIQKLIDKQRAGRWLTPRLRLRIRDPEYADMLAGCYGLAEAGLDRTEAPHRTTIVIPNYECLDYLEGSISSIKAFTDDSVDLVVVDNASSTDVQAFLDTLADEPSIRVIRNELNYGFTYAVNQGIELAKPASDIVLLNNDTLVTPGWLQAMQTVVERHEDIGIVAPRQVLPPRTETIKTHVPGADDARECDTNVSQHHANVVDPLFDTRYGLVELNFAPFFCVLITRAALDTVGLLDHETAPHYLSDRLYCDAVRYFAGMKIVYTPHAKVYHFHQRATHSLSANDKGLFDEMKGRNDWKTIVGAQRGNAWTTASGG